MRSALVLLAIGAWLAAAQAQAPADTPPTPTPAPTQAPPAATPARDSPQTLERVEISRDRETDMRRASTASRIIIGREEIDRYGDSSIAETLRRLPGITSGGRPGRGGEPRMRGMGSGYTQILINGERMPRGFSLDSLPPDQVERIEIMRAPTAEHGARAVAGTINIVLRESFEKRSNELRLAGTTERGLVRPQASWTRNDTFGTHGAYDFTVNAQHNDKRDDIDTRTLAEDLATGAAVLDQHETGRSREKRDSVHLHGRLQWRPATGSTLALQPFAMAAQWREHTARDLVQTIGATPPQYAHADTDVDGRFQMLRVNLNGQHRLREDTRFELRGYRSGASRRIEWTRHETDAAGQPVRRLDNVSHDRDRNGNLNGKLAHRTSTEHSLVGGWEFERLSREQTRTTLENGTPQLPEFGEALTASSQRLAAYVQDEWNPSRQWSASAGVRWERITTRSDDASQEARNRSDVWTPLAHAVWRPTENARDQIRLSLTRSYKSPTLSELIARPSISTRDPVPGGNVATSPDRAGNPELKPELARGLDLAYEKYLSRGGVLSVNLFYRRIADLIRTVTELEAVSWAGVPRWVARPRNVGDASTQGIELEAKFRLDELINEAAPLLINANLSVYRSRVEGVPGPNNFIDQQPRATANLGAEYRPRSAPLRLGASVNWTPAGTVQRSDIQTTTESRKVVGDVFVLWLINADTRLRLSVNNLAPRDYTSSSSILADGQRQTSIDGGATFTTVALRLEMKL